MIFFVKKVCIQAIVVHQNRAYLKHMLIEAKWSRVFLHPHGWDCRITPGIKFDGIHLHNWVEPELLHPKSRYFEDVLSTVKINFLATFRGLHFWYLRHFHSIQNSLTLPFSPSLSLVQTLIRWSIPLSLWYEGSLGDTVLHTQNMGVDRAWWMMSS